MIYFKACPKCKGDMSLERDVYGSYFACLQCGKHIDIDPRDAPRPPQEFPPTGGRSGRNSAKPGAA